MVLRVNEDRIIRAGRDAGFATDANRFVEVDNAVCALEHRRRGAGGDTRRVSTLVAAGDLMGPASLRKNTYVDVLDIGTRDRKRHQIFRLAGRCAGVTTNTPGLVDDFGPLHRAALWFFKHVVGPNLRAAPLACRDQFWFLARANYITQPSKGNIKPLWI